MSEGTLEPIDKVADAQRSLEQLRLTRTAFSTMQTMRMSLTTTTVTVNSKCASQDDMGNAHLVKRTAESKTVYIDGARSDAKFDKERQRRKNSKREDDTIRNAPLNETNDDDCGFLER